MKHSLVLIFFATFLFSYGDVSSTDRAASIKEGSGDFLRLRNENYAEIYIERVRLVQVRLQKLGYYEGEASGFYGPSTKEAIAAFQKDNYLSADGVIGPDTLDALGILPKARMFNGPEAAHSTLIIVPDF